ncbi:four-helix bundle copper-binding protein [Clostridium fermenticellae]|uniref:Four-helix bundle copper-binding protein n=1 Tax=Clostridium fermenticellae TaxID=2068654 RepID=A0A386H1V7_9CLOT|nr:four-helix bundle copper-binding protein [Clostridium fermenticellae]AYD39644.1 four-helix bundle copper-binding protein [Clostridium fermenticellae]
MNTATMSINKYQQCIDECNKCAQKCYECFKACLNEPDVQNRKNCISVLIECAQMCQMSASLMSMDSCSVKEHCRICANICDKCAQECGMFKEQHCQICMQECKKCADECRNMVTCN